jgi:hypothetical protein
MTPLRDEPAIASFEALCIVTRLVALCVELLTLVAVMVICPGTTVAGAVNVPSLAMEPAEAFHVTAELLVPCTVAVNLICPAGVNVVARGETVTRISAAV